MVVVGPGHTGIPSVWNNGVEFAFDREQYSDDAVMPARPKRRWWRCSASKMPLKEEYLYITWTRRAGTTMAIRHAEYGKAQ